MGKHGIIENKAKRCRCGRIKPAARAQCYTCKPKRSRTPPPSTEEPYTLADRVAQARACGISYGQLMRSWSWARRSRPSGRWSGPEGPRM